MVVPMGRKVKPLFFSGKEGLKINGGTDESKKFLKN